MGFSRKDLELFCQMAKSSKFAAKSIELVGLLETLCSEKIDGFFSKKKPKFLKTAKLSQFDVDCDWNSSPIWCRMRIEQWEFSKRSRVGFFAKKLGFPKKTWNFQKPLMVANLLYNAKDSVRFVKTFEFWDLELLKNTSVFWEKLKLFKMAKAANLP